MAKPPEKKEKIIALYLQDKTRSVDSIAYELRCTKTYVAVAIKEYNTGQSNIRSLGFAFKIDYEDKIGFLFSGYKEKVVEIKKGVISNADSFNKNELLWMKTNYKLSHG